MEIPGISPLSGQPTLTNPLLRESVLEGRQTAKSNNAELHNTTLVREQLSTTVSSADVVNQAEKVSSTGFDTAHIGGNIDLTA